MKSHLKRLTVPKSWKILRKTSKFALMPNPGAHSLKFGMPLGIMLRDVMKTAKNMSEVKKILVNKHVLIDNVRRTDPHYQVGLMDVLSIKETKENFRILMNKKGYLEVLAIPEKEAMLKPKKIINKTKQKNGMLQLNLFDSHNMLVKENTHKVGDTLLVEFPGRIVQHFSMSPGAVVYITGGKHLGDVGIIESIEKNDIVYKSKSGKYVCKKKYFFVIGDTQASISMPKVQ